MIHTKVFLGRAARNSAVNTDRLAKAAAAAAAKIAVPAGIEFARFEHAGRIYALSARVLIEVELLGNRVPDIVVRSGEMPRASRRRR